MQEKIGNVYGAALTVQDCVEQFSGEKAFRHAVELDSNLAVRHYLMGRGFNRVTRSFADALLKAAQ